MKSRSLILPFVLLAVISLKGQGLTTKIIKGKIVHDSLSVEGIHIINKTFGKNSITNKTGDFQVGVRLNDTIVFSAVQFKQYTIIITKELLDTPYIVIRMEQRVNELDEVVVQNHYLTGDPIRDLKNNEIEKPLNFYDLGIPGNTEEPFTQSERRLNEAITGPGGKFKWYAITAYPLNPIINGINGRTKMLKKRIAQEEKDELIEWMKSRFEKILIDGYNLKIENTYEFFLFSGDDPTFREYCEGTNDMIRFQFLVNKLMAYNKLAKDEE